MTPREHRCCFTGHREIPLLERHKVAKATATAIEELIRDGVTTFITGGAMGFDTLAAELVLKVRKHNPDVHLILALPCEDQTRGWPLDAKKKYQAIRDAADYVKVLSPHYHRGCMHVRNRYMVDNSCVCIAYHRHTGGGADYTVKYAVQQQVEVIYV